MKDESLAAPYASVSLSGRLAVALRCLELYCAAFGLAHPALEEFVERMWRLPLAMGHGPDAFRAWFDARPALFDADPGDPDAEAVLALGVACGAPAAELKALLTSVTEIPFGSFYAAPDDAGSLRHLGTVLRLAGARGVRPPPPSLVAASRFTDGQGWGASVDDSVVRRWRTAGD